MHTFRLAGPLFPGPCFHVLVGVTTTSLNVVCRYHQDAYLDAETQEVLGSSFAEDFPLLPTVASVCTPTSHPGARVSLHPQQCLTAFRLLTAIVTFLPVL